MSIVMQINPFEFFTDTQGDALDAGYVWIGEANKDPRQYPITVFYDSALTLPASMPLRTNSGYIVRNGSPTFLFVSGNYSIRVEDKRHRLVYTVPDFFFTGTGDIGSINNPAGGAAVIGRGTVAVDNIKDLLVQVQRTDLRFLVKGYSPSTTYGGGEFAWNPSIVRTSHNGGTIISPTVPWDGLPGTIAAFLAGTGETSPSAFGCFVRIGIIDSVDEFGAVGGTFDDVASFLACANAGFPVLLTRPTYTVGTLDSTTIAPIEISSEIFSKLNVTVRVKLLNKTKVTLKGVDYDFSTQPNTEDSGVFLQFCEDLDITGNRMRFPWKSALVVWDSTGGQIYRNRIFDTGRGQQFDGIVPLGCGVIVFGCVDITVDHNWIKDIWQIPVFVTGNTGHETFGIIVSNNLCRTSNDNGIRVQPDDPARALVHDVIVQGNVVMGNFTSDCIRFSGIRISVVGNKVNGAASTGIDAQFNTDSLVADNIIHNCAEGIALTSFNVVTDNVSIVNNQIMDCTGNSSAIVVSNNAASGGSFKSVRIAGNKITKRPGVAGTSRGISVSMATTTGLERITIEDNEISGYSVFGITCSNLGVLAVQGNSIGGVIGSSAAQIQAIDCQTIFIAGNKDRGPESFPATLAIRLAGANGTVSLVGNILPNSTGGLGNSGTQTALYRSGNYFVGGTPAAYTFTGGPVATRTLDASSGTAQIVGFLAQLLDDMGNDRYIHR